MLLTRLRIPASNALISSVPNILNFYNLAVFICQLLIDGRFRSGHILYDRNVFDSRLITEIESICPRQFPWQISDISQPFIPPWESHKLTDNILQLIFCDPKFMSEEIDQFEGYFIHYQIFIFSSIDETDTEGPISVIKKLNRLLLRRLSTLVLHYNTENGLIHVHSIPHILTDGSRKSEEPLDLDPRAIALRNQKTDIDNEDLFDRAFGNCERKQSIVIGVDGWIEKNDRSKEFATNPRKLFFINYYFLTLKAPYLKMSPLILQKSKIVRQYQNFMLKPRKYYKELSDEFHKFNGNDKS